MGLSCIVYYISIIPLAERSRVFALLVESWVVWVGVQARAVFFAYLID